MSEPYQQPGQGQWPAPHAPQQFPGQPQQFPGHPQNPAQWVPQTPLQFQGPSGQLVLHLKHPPGLLSKEMTTPEVSIDGFRVPAQWGDVAIQVPAGARDVGVATQYMFAYGSAHQRIDVPVNGRADLFYATPMLTFMKAAIGTSPQKNPGMMAMIAMFAGILVFVLGVFVVLAVLGSS